MPGVRMRLEKWLHSGCGKSKAPSSSNGCICRLGEAALATDEEAHALSLPVTLDHQTLTPHYNGYTGRTSGAGGFDDRGRSAILLRGAPGAPVPTRGMVETSRDAEIMRQATSRTASPPSRAPSHNQPPAQALVLPSASPIRQQLHTPIQCSDFVSPSRLNYRTSSTLDTPPTFFPAGPAARADHQGSRSSSASFDLQPAVSKELELQLGSMRHLEAFSDKAMDLNFLFLFPRNANEIHASAASSHQERIPGLVLSDFDVDVDPTICGNISDEATSLSTELNLRSISEEWMSGLRASTASSV